MVAGVPASASLCRSVGHRGSEPMNGCHWCWGWRTPWLASLDHFDQACRSEVGYHLHFSLSHLAILKKYNWRWWQYVPQTLIWLLSYKVTFQQTHLQASCKHKRFADVVQPQRSLKKTERGNDSPKDHFSRWTDTVSWLVRGYDTIKATGRFLSLCFWCTPKRIFLSVDSVKSTSIIKYHQNTTWKLILPFKGLSMYGA